MNLGTRIGLAMTGLVGITALGCASAAIGVTTQRLDAEIRRSIDLVARPVSRSVNEAPYVRLAGQRRQALAGAQPNPRFQFGTRPDWRRPRRGRRTHPSAGTDRSVFGYKGFDHGDVAIEHHSDQAFRYRARGE